MYTIYDYIYIYININFRKEDKFPLWPRCSGADSPFVLLIRLVLLSQPWGSSSGGITWESEIAMELWKTTTHYPFHRQFMIILDNYWYIYICNIHIYIYINYPQPQAIFHSPGNDFHRGYVAWVFLGTYWVCLRVSNVVGMHCMHVWFKRLHGCMLKTLRFITLW